MGLKRGWLACTLALACGGDGEDAPEAALPEVGVALTESGGNDAPEPRDPLQARRAYLTQWSRCLLRTGGRLERSWARLDQDVDIDKAKVRKKDIKPFLDTLGPELLDSCPLGTKPPPGTPPQLPTQGRAYVLAARGYGNRAAELREYFDTEAYVSDQGEALATDLPALQTAYTQAHDAAETFEATLEAALDDADTAWLEALGRSGHADTAAWHVTNAALAGRALSPCITEQRPTPPACTAASETFSAARDGLEAWRGAHPADALGVFWLDVFRQRATDLEAAVAGLKTPVSKRKKPADVRPAAARQRVADARGALQNAANTVVFDFP